MLSRAAVNSPPSHEAPPIVHEVLHSPGEPLDAVTRAFMEPRFGHDFSRVRVHTDAKAAESARAVDALAYTVGRNVVFGDGQYMPGMSEGRKLMAHELTHVVQQDSVSNDGSVTNEITIAPSSGAFEDEAKQNAESHIGNKESKTRGYMRVLQRQSAPDTPPETPEARIQRQAASLIRVLSHLVVSADARGDAGVTITIQHTGDELVPSYASHAAPHYERPSGMTHASQPTIEAELRPLLQIIRTSPPGKWRITFGRTPGGQMRIQRTESLPGGQPAASGSEETVSKESSNLLVVSRGEWGASPPDKTKGWDEYPTSAPLPLYRIIIHHTADPQSQTVKQLQDKQMKAGYADVAYHFVITGDGAINEGRKIEAVGAHAGQIKGNIDITKDPDWGSIGIVLTGDFESRWQNRWRPDTPTAAQLSSLEKLLRDLMLKYNIPASNIFKHTEVRPDPTDCPGQNLAPHVERLRTQLAQESTAKGQVLQRKVLNQAENKNRMASHIVPNVLRASGEPLETSTRRFMERRFGHDFSHVRVHTDTHAAESARAVNARAYTVGQHVVFGSGQYSPHSNAGRQVLAHELTHTIQQSRGGVANLAGLMKVSEPSDADEREAEFVAATALATGNGETMSADVQPATSAVQRLGDLTKVPSGLLCDVATDSPASTIETLFYDNEVFTLTSGQEAQIQNFIMNWQAAGANAPVRVDGYASTPGTDELNWRLSCDRAMWVANELMTPSSSNPGIPASFIRTVAQGETTQFGAEAENRRATISSPITVSPTPPPAPPCPFPVLLGSARGCGLGSDFTHFDHPSISTASEAKLGIWAATRTPMNVPVRALVSNTQCELEMDGVLIGLAGGAGHAAFTHFRAGTGSTITHGPTSALGAMALSSGSFLATVARVKRAVELQLAAQAAAGALDPCALSVAPPATHFAFSDGSALKAVIGGTQGEQLFATGFSGSLSTRNYTISLRFLICDDFGVDESDLYAPGLFPFWVLQHERSASLYAPFINELDLPVTVSGTF